MADLLGISLDSIDPTVSRLPDHPATRKEDNRNPDSPTEIKPPSVVPKFIRPLPLIARKPNFHSTSLSRAGEALLWAGISSLAGGIAMAGGGAIGDVTRSLNGEVMNRTSPAGLGLGVGGFTLIIASFGMMIATNKKK